jgi:hypothetical protein
MIHASKYLRSIVQLFGHSAQLPSNVLMMVAVYLYEGSWNTAVSIVAGQLRGRNFSPYKVKNFPFSMLCNRTEVTANDEQIPWPLVRKRTIPTERLPLVRKIWCQLLRTEGCHVVNVADPPQSLVSFLDRSHYFSFR